MDPITAAILSDPKAWAAALLLILGTPIAWLWRQFTGLRTRMETCEREKAVLLERLTAMNEKLAVERGRVDTLTDLFGKEAHLG